MHTQRLALHLPTHTYVRTPLTPWSCGRQPLRARPRHAVCDHRWEGTAPQQSSLIRRGVRKCLCGAK
eukprot:45187-Eustigmatos_ZCMA.PRE.1